MPGFVDLSAPIEPSPRGGAERVSVRGDVSSQFLTGILQALPLVRRTIHPEDRGPGHEARQPRDLPRHVARAPGLQGGRRPAAFARASLRAVVLVAGDQEEPHRSLGQEIGRGDPFGERAKWRTLG